MRFAPAKLVAIVSLLLVGAARGADIPAYRVGVARIDITPNYPIRLCGYAARQKESEGVEQHLWAKALAIDDGKNGVALLVTVDNTAVPGSLIEQLAQRLQSKAKVARERLVVCSSHTHCAPCIVGGIPNMFGHPIPAEQTATMERYTRELLDDLEKVSLEAISSRKSARLSWGIGSANFAANRRTKGGPTEHAMPMLSVTGEDGSLRAVVIDYACHCTTLGGDFNKICGDWAGYAQQYIQDNHPGAIAMVTLGCAGDANPAPRGTLKDAQDHGREIASAVDALLRNKLTPLTSDLNTAFKRTELAFDPLPSKEKWEELAKREDAIGGNARLQLAQLNSGKPLPTGIPYVVETWTFGDQLAMVFLAGEVVVDYDLRLKHDFDPSRLWISAYSNDVPCYIPSKRVLAEGGYEAEGAMTYYGRPGRLAPGCENQIIRTVHDLLPVEFRSKESLREFPPPLSPAEALKAFRVADGLKVELAASEPLIEDPVAIDWGPDGKLWVVEMHDYPNGLYENGVPGGRIKVLESTHHDGHYDKATLFLDGLRMPDGIMVWGKGVLICAAPDIIYAEDTNGDGKADVTKVLVTGFGPKNEQWLVNGLAYGLDNWVYGASSISNGPIQVTASGKTIDLGNRDFRMRPDSGEFEPASGRTQYCRVRDDWGNWFGNDNSNLLWHYPLAERYLVRNPRVSPPPSMVLVPQGYDVNRLFPASRILQRFNDPGSAGRTTSACGPTIYRDDLLGSDFSGNAFICEPVHDLVHRLVLERDGVTFRARRSPDNQASEFLASTDNWFRPVQARTGPDGALWVVDMYRFVIEHPRWITPDRLARLDIRAGADKGRIYRVVPTDRATRPVPNLSDASAAELAKLLDSPNGTFRDMVQKELLRRGDRAAVAVLEQVARSGTSDAARAQALWALRGLHALSEQDVEAGLADRAPGVRRNAVQLSESFLPHSPGIQDRVLHLAEDSDPVVRYQVALSLGEWSDPRAAEALGRLAARDLDDPWQRAAAVSSCGTCALDVLQRVLAKAPDGPERTELVGQLAATSAATDDSAHLSRLITAITPVPGQAPVAWQFLAMGDVADSLAARQLNVESAGPEAAKRLGAMISAARSVAPDASAPEPLRLAAVRLMGHHDATKDELDVLSRLLDPQAPEPLRDAALRAMARSKSDEVAGLLLNRWASASPSLRSQIVDTLLSRQNWAEALLGAMDRKLVKAGEITPAARARLLASAVPEVHSRADALLNHGAHVTRQKVLDEFKPALSMVGDASKGAELFAKTCTSCHSLGGQGHAVGPDLTTLTDRSPQALLIAILDPNAAVDGKFVNYLVRLRDGRTLSGIIADENAAAITVLQPNGIRDTVLRRDIDKIRSSGLSLMPEGLEAGLTSQDLANLIAYVRSAGPSRAQ